MLIPVVIGPITFTVRDFSGNVVATEVEPAVIKGSPSSNPNATTTCSFTSSFTEDGLTGTARGTWTGFVTGQR